MEKTKDIEIDGRAYQVGRFNPRDGSWVAFLLLTKVMTMFGPGFSAAIGLPSMPEVEGEKSAITEAEFHNIQDHCLRICAIYPDLQKATAQTAAITAPVLTADGRFTDDAITLKVVMKLTFETLLFNCSDLFPGGAVATGNTTPKVA